MSEVPPKKRFRSYEGVKVEGSSQGSTDNVELSCFKDVTDKPKLLPVNEEKLDDASVKDGHAESSKSMAEATDEDDQSDDGFKDVPELMAEFSKVPYTTIQKLVFDDGETIPEQLPLGWSRQVHQCGVPFYMHRPTRVCTLSRPYFIGKCDSLMHDIPVSAIPCLAYKMAQKNYYTENTNPNLQKYYFSFAKDAGKTDNVCEAAPSKDPSEANTSNMINNDIHTVDNVLDEEDKIDSDDEDRWDKIDASFEDLRKHEDNEDGARGIDDDVAINIKESSRKNYEDNDSVQEIQTLEDNVSEKKYLSHDQVIEYCQKLFKYRPVEFQTFKRWSHRRKFRKIGRALFRSALAERSQVFHLPSEQDDKHELDGKLSKYPFVLHEYVRTIRRQHRYQYDRIASTDTPYVAWVYVAGELYGSGRGYSKKHARALAARAALYALVPELSAERSSTPPSVRAIAAAPAADLADSDHDNNNDPSFAAPLA